MDLQKHLGSILLGVAAIGTVVFASALTESVSESEDSMDDDEDEFESSSDRETWRGRDGIDARASRYMTKKYGALGKYFGRT